MKKFLVLLFLLLTVTQVNAQNRAAMSSFWASTYNVAATDALTITFPFQTRDIVINNGSSVAICVDLKGSSVSPSSCNPGSVDYYGTKVQIPGGDELALYDYVTPQISISTVTTVASPVSVIITY